MALKFLLFFAFVGLGSQPSFARQEAIAKCAAQYAALPRTDSAAAARVVRTLPAALPEQASLAEIRARYSELQNIANQIGVPLHGAPTTGRIDDRIQALSFHSQRLYDDIDYEAMAACRSPSWSGMCFFNHRERAYTESYRQYLSAVAFVERENAGGLELGPELLQAIHRQAFSGLPFHGFEGRRLALRFERGEIDRSTYDRLRREAFEQNREIAGVPHATLVGRFRDSEIDQIVHQGSSFLPDGTRYFTASELAAMQRNPWIRSGNPPVEFAPGQFRASFYYHDVKAIDAAVTEVFASARAALANAKTDAEKVRAIVKLQHDLVSIHPFLDGNGRSIRLLGDLLYQRHGLPPVSRPNNRDLEMTASEAEAEARRGMVAYLNRWLSYFATRAP